MKRGVKKRKIIPAPRSHLGLRPKRRPGPKAAAADDDDGDDDDDDDDNDVLIYDCHRYMIHIRLTVTTTMMEEDLTAHSILNLQKVILIFTLWSRASGIQMSFGFLRIRL